MPASLALTPFNVRLWFVSPPKALLPLYHWYRNGPVPPALTLKLALVPGQLVAFAGALETVTF